MKVAIYNDTSYYHAGCKAVMSYLRQTLEHEGHEIVASARRMTLDDPNFKEFCTGHFDAVVLNGEGSLHHDRPGAILLTDAISILLDKGKKVYVVNALWQEMASIDPSLVERLEGVQVREGLSADEFENQFGQRPPVYLDFSFFSDVTTTPPAIDFRDGVARTDFLWPDYNNFVSPTMGPLARFQDLPMHHLGWDECVASLKTARLLVTGRHHAVLAALKSRTPFVALSGNSHKIEGVMRDAAFSVPVATTPIELQSLIERALSGEFDWEPLFDWAETQPRWPGLNIFE